MADSPLLGHFDPASSRLVEELFQGSASRMRTRLVNRIGTDLPITSRSLEWSQLGPVLDTLPPGAAIASFRMEPSGLLGLVAIENEVLTRLVGQILGQPKDVAWSGQTDRAPSRFDLVVARRIAEDVTGGMTEVFPATVCQRVTVNQVGTSSRVGLAIARTAFVGAATFDVRAPGDVTGRFVVAVPSEITRLAAPRRPPRTAADHRTGMERVLPLPVTVVAELRRVFLSLAQLKLLAPGQMLELGPPKDVVIRVGDRPALVGEAGVQNALRSVRVKGRVEGGMLR